MRDFLMRPWVYRLTCAAVTLAAMVGVGIGLRALKATQSTALALEVGLPILALLLLFGWLMNRAGAGRE